MVLGGGVRKGPDGTVGLTEDSVMRCLHAAALVKRIGPKPIVLTGGILPSVPSGPPVAEIMQRFLTGLAVPAESLLLDVSATTTYENAVGTRRVLAPIGIQQVALVTDAFHMPRALGVFEAQGLIARPAPLNYRAARFPWGLQMLLPDARAVAQIEAASHEWMGLAWYWLRRRL